MASKKQVRKSNFSLIKTFVIVFIVFGLGVAGGFFANKKFNAPPSPNINKNINKFVNPEKTQVVEIYFVKGKKNQGVTYLEYLPVKRAVKKGENQFKTAVTELLKGPSSEEKQQGINTEIPTSTKLLEIVSDSKSYTINLSNDFQVGGGTNSMQARIYQLVKTVRGASGGKDVYLELNGEKVDVIGGEGIIIKQPINKNL